MGGLKIQTISPAAGESQVLTNGLPTAPKQGTVVRALVDMSTRLDPLATSFFFGGQLKLFQIFYLHASILRVDNDNHSLISLLDNPTNLDIQQ